MGRSTVCGRGTERALSDTPHPSMPCHWSEHCHVTQGWGRGRGSQEVSMCGEQSGAPGAGGWACQRQVSGLVDAGEPGRPEPGTACQLPSVGPCCHLCDLEDKPSEDLRGKMGTVGMLCTMTFVTSPFLQFCLESGCVTTWQQVVQRRHVHSHEHSHVHPESRLGGRGGACVTSGLHVGCPFHWVGCWLCVWSRCRGGNLLMFRLCSLNQLTLSHGWRTAPRGPFFCLREARER